MKEKTKEFLKKNLIGFILGFVSVGIVVVYAETYFPSNDVTYDNTESGLSSTNVQGAIDELYGVCTAEPPAGEQIIENAGLEKDPYEAQLRQARAQTQQAKTQLIKARRDAKRASELIKVNAVSRQEYDDAQSALAVAKSALALAQAQQTNAEIDLSHAMVPAPVDGIAGKSEVNIGSLITSGTTLLTSITQPDTLRVSFAVSDKNLVGAQLTKDNLVRVFIPDTKDFLPAKLDYIGQQIDADRGTLRLRAVLPPTKKLLPGQYVEVRLMLGEYKDAYLVPQGVVRQRSDGTYSVYVIEEGVAREKEVLLGNWEGSDWIVTNGLKPGDKVITNQILRLRDGLRVTEKSSDKTDSSEPVKP